MHDPLVVLGFLYFAGVLWGLVATDASPGGRIALSLLWPLGPLAFVLTIALLLLAAPVALLGRRSG